MVKIFGQTDSGALAFVRVYRPDEETRKAAPGAAPFWTAETQRGYDDIIGECRLPGRSNTVEFYSRDPEREYEVGQLKAFFALGLTDEAWEAAWDKACEDAGRQAELLELIEEFEE